MATSWPQEAAWPTDLREHATYLSRYLRDALQSIDREKDRPVPPQLAKVMIMGSLSLVLKLQNTPDLHHVHDTLSMARTEATATAASTSESLQSIKVELKHTMESVQQAVQETKEAKMAAKEAVEANKTLIGLVRDLKSTSHGGHSIVPPTYAAMAARNTIASSAHNMQSYKATPAQTMREIIVNIRNPHTVANIRTMSPRNLKAHVDRAIEQSGHEHIGNIKVASANQLKSGDLSIKTSSTAETEVLRQFAEDWEGRLGSNATVRIPTYGVLAHGIRTNSITMDNFDRNRDEVLQDNKPFIPNATIKYIGWLTKTSATKSASSIIIEFTRAEDANKIIDEGLIWQGEVFQCERYDRECRVKQCYQCHKYGHIGTQCKATTTCGYCAHEHATRDCPNKSDKSKRKCAVCHGEHEAWSSRCQERKDALAKVKAAYLTRQRFHPEPAAVGTHLTPRAQERQARMTIGRRPVLDATRQPRTGRSISPAKRAHKRVNPGDGTVVEIVDENSITANGGRSRPQRAANPSRRALEAIEANARQIHINHLSRSIHSTQQMDIDTNTCE